MTLGKEDAGGRIDGGTSVGGRLDGRSFPSRTPLIRCMATAKVFLSRRPLLLISARSLQRHQILTGRVR